MIEAKKLSEIISDLGENYNNDTNVILNLYDRISTIASQNSNRTPDDPKLYPYIVDAVKAEYLARGAEGLQSRGEGSISSSYKDIIKEMRTNIISAGLRRVK